MKKKFVLTAMLGVALALGMVFVGCSDGGGGGVDPGTGGDGNGSSGSSWVIETWADPDPRSSETLTFYEGETVVYARSAYFGTYTVSGDTVDTIISGLHQTYRHEDDSERESIVLIDNHGPIGGAIGWRLYKQ